MNQRPTIIVSTLGLAVLFGLIYKLRQQGASAEELKLIRELVEKNLAETQTMHRNLRRQRGAVNQLHRYVMPSTKG